MIFLKKDLDPMKLNKLVLSYNKSKINIYVFNIVPCGLQMNII